MADSELSGVSLASLGAGILLLWAGIKGESVIGSLKDLTMGQAPSSTQTTPINVGTSFGGTGNSGNSGASGSVPSNNASAAQSYAKSQLSKYGWDSSQMTPLVNLWNQESGWSNTAQNPSSGAYGIAQALPPTKYPKAAQPPSLGGSSDTQAQIDWGLSYIAGRYGSPEMAWAHEQSNDWY